MQNKKYFSSVAQYCSVDTNLFDSFRGWEISSWLIFVVDMSEY